MEKKNKGSNTFFNILGILFILFLCLHSMGMNGYVEGLNKNKTLYTEEMIDKFESDIKNGVDVNIEDYKLDEEKDYTNKFSDFGESLSNLISIVSLKVIDFFGNVFSHLLQ